MSDALAGCVSAANMRANTPFDGLLRMVARIASIHLQKVRRYAFLSQNPGNDHALEVSNAGVAQMKLLVQPIKIFR
jgi:hypothetical protein